MKFKKIEENLKNEYEKSKLKWTYYSCDKKKIILDEISDDFIEILDVFKTNMDEISSLENKKNTSNEVLKKLINNLNNENGYESEVVIKFDKEQLIKSFRVDLLNIKKNIIIEVEAGRAVSNYQILKDIMECSMISYSPNGVYLKNEEKLTKFNGLYLVVAVRNKYNEAKNYDSVLKWLRAFEISKLELNLNGILLIGY